MKRDLNEDLAICGAATAGPWRRKGGNAYAGDELVLRMPPSPRGYGGGDASLSIDQRDANSRFGAEARAGWPHAIERAQAAEAEVERLREHLREVVELIQPNETEYKCNYRREWALSRLYPEGAGADE